MFINVARNLFNENIMNDNDVSVSFNVNLFGKLRKQANVEVCPRDGFYDSIISHRLTIIRVDCNSVLTH